MLLHGRVYRKVDNDRWMQISEVPELFNDISISDTNDQLVVADRMEDWAAEFMKPIKPLRVERLLASDLIVIIAFFTKHEGFEDKLVLWGKSDFSLVRKGDQTYWDDVKATVRL